MLHHSSSHSPGTCSHQQKARQCPTCLPGQLLQQLLLILFKVPLNSSFPISQKRGCRLFGMDAAFWLHRLYPSNFRGRKAAKPSAMLLSKHFTYLLLRVQGKQVSFYLCRFSSGFTSEVLRTKFLKDALMLTDIGS